MKRVRREDAEHRLLRPSKRAAELPPALTKSAGPAAAAAAAALPGEQAAPPPAGGQSPGEALEALLVEAWRGGPACMPIHAAPSKRSHLGSASSRRPRPAVTQRCIPRRAA